MANSWQTEIGAAGQVTITVNIPYLSQSDISVYANGNEVKPLTWDSATVVHLPAALKGGEEILVMRRTERDALRIQFSEGAAFDRSNMDEQNTQFLYLSQELVEGRSIEGFYGDISMNTFRITNLGTPIYDTDAANKKYVDAEVQEVNQKAIRVPEATVAPTPTLAGRRNKLLGFDSIGNPVSATPIEGSATELELALQDIDGLSLIGRVPSLVELRALAPKQDRRFVNVVAYKAGGTKGGGFFEYMGTDTTSADDGGLMIVGLNGARWRRVIDLSAVTIEHFGAVSDGVTDDIEALKRMHAWSRTIDATFGPGIVLGPGITVISDWDLGTAEIPAFKMRGPEIAYGRIPRAQLKLIGNTAAYALRFKARRMEVANLNINGAGSTKGFLENTVTRGDYCRIHAIQARAMTGRTFHVFDTIDTTVSQCYSSQGKASFFRTDWSNENPGAWDHPTAIKIIDCNFEGHTGEFAVSAIRAGQSVMDTVWFDHCNQGFDISQGGWLLNNVTQENSTLPSGAQYAKVIQIKCRFAQGAGLSPDVSGYDPAQDPSGSMPSWVNSVYERGTANFDQLGFLNTGSMSFGYESSQYKMSNMTDNAVWYELGTLGFSGATGVSCDIELVGTGHFDSAVSDARAASTNFGGGKAVIRVQQKDSNTKMAASWYGEQASPISDVRILLGNKNRPRIFVQLRGYTGGVATTFHTNDKSNFEGGQHFYLSPVFTAIDMATVPAAVQVPAHWSVNNSTYGLGMNMTDGKLVMDGPALPATNASSHLPIQYNGSEILLAVQPNPQTTRVQHCTLATLPRATENPWSSIIVTDAVSGNGVTQARLCFCNGLFWYTADGSVSLGAGVSA